VGCSTVAPVAGSVSFSRAELAGESETVNVASAGKGSDHCGFFGHADRLDTGVDGTPNGCPV
jgi:hypothetical protein